MRFRRHLGGVEETCKKGVTAYNDKVFAVTAFESRPLGHWRNHSAEPKQESPRRAVRSESRVLTFSEEPFE